jgi:ubiquinol-cytochrome c reductase iron-sulfur subunit
MTATVHDAGPQPDGEVPRRDFLTLTVGAAAGLGAAALAWPLLDNMNPSADVLALGSIEVDLSSIEPGQGIVVSWRGKPVFVRRRTQAEIAAAGAVPLGTLRDPQADQDRVQPDHAEWLVVIGVCTHLGCVPGGSKVTEPRGEYGGWFCACHGSHYDTAGRVRKGPAPLNLPLPPYAFLGDTTLKIG